MAQEFSDCQDGECLTGKKAGLEQLFFEYRVTNGPIQNYMILQISAFQIRLHYGSWLLQVWQFIIKFDSNFLIHQYDIKIIFYVH